MAKFSRDTFLFLPPRPPEWGRIEEGLVAAPLRRVHQDRQPGELTEWGCPAHVFIGDQRILASWSIATRNNSMPNQVHSGVCRRKSGEKLGISKKGLEAAEKGVYGASNENLPIGPDAA